MSRLIILLALVVAGVTATVAWAAPWSNSPSWSNQRLTYEVRNLRAWLDEEQLNREFLSWQHTKRELQILKCVRAPEGQEQDCVDALGEFGVTDPYLETILP